MSAQIPEQSGEISAVEFFSGIGAFAQAASAAGISVVAAFDQSQHANHTYQMNYGLKPQSRNLDSISAAQIPEADIWWLSPPCTPYSVRGKRRDDADPRAASFLNLISMIGDRRPPVVFVENVTGFTGSRVHQRLMSVLADGGYAVREFDLCPTSFGVPMRRPRHFLAAARGGRNFDDLRNTADNKMLSPVERKLSDFLEPNTDPALQVEEEVMSRYGQGFDIVDPLVAGAYLTCFTSGYWRCRKASGSLLALPGGGARRVSPYEILRLLGFAPDFVFPDSIDLPARFRLAGNSVDVRAIKFLLDVVGYRHVAN